MLNDTEGKNKQIIQLKKNQLVDNFSIFCSIIVGIGRTNALAARTQDGDHKNHYHQNQNNLFHNY